MKAAAKIAAHRGGAQLWPENSRLAFRNAIEMEVDFIEFDVHRTRDGVLVVHHDAVLGRTCEGSGAIAEQNWSDLEPLKLHGASGETIPTLSEVLDILELGSPALRLEIKYRQDGSRYPGIEADVLSVLRERNLLSRTTFTAFDLDVLRELVLLAPGQPLIHLIREHAYQASGRLIREYAESAHRAGVNEIAIRIEHIQEGDVEQCEALGIKLGVYAAHDVPSIELAFNLRVSAFTTDRPDLAVAINRSQVMPGADSTIES